MLVSESVSQSVRLRDVELASQLTTLLDSRIRSNEKKMEISNKLIKDLQLENENLKHQAKENMNVVEN